MEQWEIKYDELRNLYSKVDTKLDSIGKGIATERIINDLLRDIAKPYKIDLNITLGKSEFDGRIALGPAKNILYEIELGVLPKFKYYRILSDIPKAHFPGKTYFLIIAYRFSQDDKIRIEELTHSVYQTYASVSFMDYETLIALHKFAPKINANDEQELKLKKRLFLERLFQSTAMVTQSYFSGAISYAEERLLNKYSASKPITTQQALIIQSGRYVERIEKLERITRELLNEIQALKDYIRNKESAEDR